MATLTTIRGPLRADRRTKDLVKRLRPGEIALIHHADLDAVAARALVERRVGAVVNAVRSVSGKYPNGGPTVLLDAGIPLLDGVGDEFFERALKKEGAAAELVGDSIRLDQGLCATGEIVTITGLSQQLEAARENLSGELDRFARNTLAYLVEEKALLLDPPAVPDLKTHFAGRHAMVVVRGEGFDQDIRRLGAYLADVRPVMIGVDGGADALIEEKFKPDIIIGDMDSVSDKALRCGAELVVHGYPDSEREAPGLKRIQALGLEAKVFRAAGTSEDIAMMLADAKGATLIVAVGTHLSLEEFLDKGRAGMSSTFLVRLRLGSKIVDAKGIGRLWSMRNRPATREILLIMAAALVPIGAVFVLSPYFRTVLNTLRLAIRSTFGLN